MAFSDELATRQLLHIYRTAQAALVERIAKRRATGLMIEFHQEILNDVNEMIMTLDRAVTQWTNQVIPAAYNEGRTQSLQGLERAGIRPRLRAGFARVHRDAIKLMAENFQTNLVEAHRFVGRQINDAWRRAQLEAVAQRLTQSQTHREAKRSFMRIIGEQGLGAFKDSKRRV